MKKIRDHISYLFWGALFGFIISRSGAARFDYVHGMFLLSNLTLYGIIASAITVAMPGIWIMQRMQRAGKIKGSIPFPRRRMTLGTIPGAALFGVGWAVTGTCPGPAAVQLGEGHWVALATLAGILLGNMLYAKIHRQWFSWRIDTCT